MARGLGAGPYAAGVGRTCRGHVSYRSSREELASADLQMDRTRSQLQAALPEFGPNVAVVFLVVCSGLASLVEELAGRAGTDSDR